MKKSELRDLIYQQAKENAALKKENKYLRDTFENARNSLIATISEMMGKK